MTPAEKRAAKAGGDKQNGGGRKRKEAGAKPAIPPAPLGFALSFAVGKSLSDLAKTYGVHWTRAREWSLSEEVIAEVQSLKADVRAFALTRIQAEIGPSIDAIVAVRNGTKDEELRFEVSKYFLALVGIAPTNRSSIEITPGNAAAPKTDAELLAELHGLRAQVLPHPQPTEEPLPAALALSPDVEGVQ